VTQFWTVDTKFQKFVEAEIVKTATNCLTETFNIFSEFTSLLAFDAAECDFPAIVGMSRRWGVVTSTRMPVALKGGRVAVVYVQGLPKDGGVRASARVTNTRLFGPVRPS
jgi:hypothetical protein